MMKNVHKRLLAILFCFALLLPLCTGVSAAEEDEESLDAYIFHHNVADDDYDGPNLQYFSPYVTDYTYDGASTYIQNNIFSLYNTLSGEVVPVYCTDIQVGALPDHRYRRLNLEDSTYAASAAGQLRAIMRNGFYVTNIPGESDADHAVRVAENLQKLGAASGVPDLTIGEAISGTQSAIWQAAHGSRLVYTDFVRTIYTSKVSTATRYYDLCNEERENGHIDYTVSAYGKVTVDPNCDARINARIKAVYDYLLSLEPVEPNARVVSNASFLKVTDPVLTENDDGTYDMTVDTTVDVSLVDGDYLSLTAKLEDAYQASTTLSSGKQNATLTLENIPASLIEGDVRLTIQGMQTASEVFLYDAYGDRETAQTMIGMDDSQVPVYASVLATNDRILSIRKTTRGANGTNDYTKEPLEGIIFDLYLVATMEEYTGGTVTLPEAKDYAYPAVANHTLITDEDGRASLNFTQNGLPDGVYLVVEREHPAIEAPIEPFYLFMPNTAEDGTIQYQVSIQPKNDVKGGVTIDKDITSLGNDSSTVNAYEDHTWIVSTSIPDDIGSGKSYVVSDTLDNRLDFTGNVVVQLESNDGQTVLTTLTRDTDYTLHVIDVDSLAAEGLCDSFTVSVTPAGMSKIAQTIGENRYSDYKLRVYFTSQINANGEAGEQIPNHADLDYTNSVNFDYHVRSDEPVVYTGGTNLLKVDSVKTEKVLPGAVFEVYRYATAEEVAAGSSLITHIPGVSGAVVKVSFFDNAELNGEKVTSVTTSAEGKAAIYGLAYGDYFLLETQAPAGYNPPEGAAKITIDGGSHSMDNTVTVKNVGGSILPSTGGIGTGIFYFTGIAVLCAAAFLLLSQKRKAC